MSRLLFGDIRHFSSPSPLGTYFGSRFSGSTPPNSETGYGNAEPLSPTPTFNQQLDALAFAYPPQAAAPVHNSALPTYFAHGNVRDASAIFPGASNAVQQPERLTSAGLRYLSHISILQARS
jgi:hypothetical protein